MPLKTIFVIVHQVQNRSSHNNPYLILEKHTYSLGYRIRISYVRKSRTDASKSVVQLHVMCCLWNNCLRHVSYS
jgi:hypothetical protein